MNTSSLAGVGVMEMEVTTLGVSWAATALAAMSKVGMEMVARMVAV